MIKKLALVSNILKAFFLTLLVIGIFISLPLLIPLLVGLGISVLIFILILAFLQEASEDEDDSLP